MSNEILYIPEPPLGEIILNRPDKMNAMTPAMAEDLQRICSEIDESDAIRVVLFRANGDKAFCAGSDIKALDEYNGPFDFRNRVEYATQIRNLRKPCVVAIKGWTLGGGLELALSADIRIAAESTKMGAPEVTLGWVGAGGASQLLPRLIGYGKAMHMLLQGDPINSSLALQWGLVEEVVADGTEVDRAREIASRIATHTAVATQTVKAAVRQSLSTSLEEGLRYENEVMSLAFALGNDIKGREDFEKKS